MTAGGGQAKKLIRSACEDANEITIMMEKTIEKVYK
jgi:hypothetical protein